jgi:hypothetical protein
LISAVAICFLTNALYVILPTERLETDFLERERDLERERLDERETDLDLDEPKGLVPLDLERESDFFDLERERLDTDLLDLDLERERLDTDLFDLERERERLDTDLLDLDLEPLSQEGISSSRLDCNFLARDPELIYIIYLILYLKMPSTVPPEFYRSH